MRKIFLPGCLILFYSLILAGANLLNNKHWQSADELKILAINYEENSIAIQTKGSIEGIGGTVPFSIHLVDIKTYNSKEIIIGKNIFIDNDNRTDQDIKDEQMRSKKNYTKTISNLKADNYIFSIIENPIPDRFTLFYKAFKTEEGTNGIVKFFVKDNTNGNIFFITKRQHDFYNNNDIKINKSFSGPQKINFFIYYRTPHIMEYYEGVTGLLILNKSKISYIFNFSGYQYYKNNKIKLALADFLEALKYDQDNMQAVYNTACMYGILNSPSNSVKYLKILKANGSPFAKSKIEKAKKDMDFSNIRNSKEFQSFFD